MEQTSSRHRSWLMEWRRDMAQLERKGLLPKGKQE